MTVDDYQDLQDDYDNDNDDCMVICFEGQIQKKRKNGQNSTDLWSHLLFGIIWSWKKGSFKLNFWSNLAPRETINVRLIQFSNQTIGAQECLKKYFECYYCYQNIIFNQIETSVAKKCLSEKYFEYYNHYQNIIFNQIETIGAHECLKNILSIAIVIKILFFNQIETSAAQECLNFFAYCYCYFKINHFSTKLTLWD